MHPIAILDHLYQGSLYSTRSNNAGACVADFAPESFYDFMAAMYVNQPAETSTGLTNGEIVDVAKGAGVDDADVDKCINGASFESWVTAATERAHDRPAAEREHRERVAARRRCSSTASSTPARSPTRPPSRRSSRTRSRRSHSGNTVAQSSLTLTTVNPFDAASASAPSAPLS